MSEQTHQRDRCAIAGIGSTDFSGKSGRSVLTLALEASTAAMADAGLLSADVNGIIASDHDEVNPLSVAAALGVPDLHYWATVGTGGNAPCGMVANAVAAVVSGAATTVLVFRALNGRSGRRFGLAPPGAESTVVGGNSSFEEYFLPFGLHAPGSVFALLAARHMDEYGTSIDDLGAIAVACRAHAQLNPRAQMYGRPMTLDDHHESRVLSTPLRLFDFCLETDGASAVLVTSTERARDLAQPPALIRAATQATADPGAFAKMFPTLLVPDILSVSSGAVARRLYSTAGLGPDEIDVAQIYDCFTISVLMQLEDYQFCSRGEGGPFASSGVLGPGGDLPINTGGGHLSEGYIHGLNHIVEGVRQIRGTSTSQRPGAETCLVTSAPLGPGASALILRGDS